MRVGAPFGPALLGDGSLASNVVDGGGVIAVPLRFFACTDSCERGEGPPSELVSGRWFSQRLPFACRPRDVALFDFFGFAAFSASDLIPGGELWTAEEDAAAAGDEVSQWRMSARALLHAARRSSAGAGVEPGGYCILTPKVTAAWQLAERLAPQRLDLEIVVMPPTRVPGSAAKNEFPPARAALSWQFVPQFAVMNRAGKQLSPGARIAVLTPQEPMSTVWLWTGGYAVEASLVGSLPPGRGSVAVHVSAVPPTAEAPTPSVSLTVVWNNASASSWWGPSEDLRVRLECRASGQVEVFVVRFDGRAHAGLQQARSLCARIGTRGFLGAFFILLFGVRFGFLMPPGSRGHSSLAARCWTRPPSAVEAAMFRPCVVPAVGGGGVGPAAAVAVGAGALPRFPGAAGAAAGGGADAAAGDALSPFRRLR